MPEYSPTACNSSRLQGVPTEEPLMIQKAGLEQEERYKDIEINRNNIIVFPKIVQDLLGLLKQYSFFIVCQVLSVDSSELEQEKAAESGLESYKEGMLEAGPFTRH